MATLQLRGDSWRVLFKYGGELRTFTIGNVEELEAHQWKARTEFILMRLKQRLLSLPAGVDIVTFIQHDGKPPPEVVAAAPPKPEMTFAEFRDSFLRTFSGGSVEDNTLSTATIHMQHLVATLGAKFPIAALAHADLQKHIDRRQKDGVAPVTMKKEIETLKGAWNWGRRMSYVEGDFPGHGLRYPKSVEKMPFMTWEEIERRIKAGGDESLWDCLYLTAAQMTELLAFVKQAQAPPWFHPMLAFACHTGARRSEMMRSEVQDIDLAGKWITIREKKKRRGEYTTRRVPVSSALAVTGVGFKPKALLLMTNVDGAAKSSHGFSDGTTSRCQYTTNAAAWTQAVGVSRIYTDGSNFADLTVASFDADGFTLTRSKTGAPTGTANISYIAIR